MASSCASDIRSVTVAVASSSLGISDATTRTNSTGCVHAAVISAGLPKACHASQRSRKNSSLSLLREPFGRPLGLPDWPGLNWVNSLPVTWFPPVDLRSALDHLSPSDPVHRCSLHRTARDQPSIKPALTRVMSVAFAGNRDAIPSVSGCGTPSARNGLCRGRRLFFWILSGTKGGTNGSHRRASI